MATTQEYKLFLGCLIPNRLPFLEKSGKYVFEKIGLKTSPAEFGCCPNPVGLKFVDEKSWYALSARNIAIAEEEGKPITSMCNGCYQSLAVVDHELKHDEKLKNDVNKILKVANREYKGTTNIEHFVVTLAEKVGLDHIKQFITRPLTGLKVALHPGCHYARPSHVLHVEEDVFALKNLRDLAKITGVEVVDYEQENLCCGNAVRQTDEGTANVMLKTKIDGANRAGADLIVVNCPACFQQFDGEQRRLIKMEEDGKTRYKVPIFYITELLALAMGASPDRTWNEVPSESTQKHTCKGESLKSVPDKVYEVEPVTRLEGHGGLRLVLGEDGKTVKDVQFNITSTRFFEKLCEGRYAEHVPRITNRICGICPVPHHLAATKSVEAAWGVEIPQDAYKLRQLFMNAKQYSSHLLHFFALAAPDFVYGPFAPPAKRNVVNIIKDLPEVGKMALEMMDFGQNIGAAIGGKAVGPISGIVGGMRNPLKSTDRDAFIAQIPQQLEYVKATVDLAKKVVTDYWDVVANLAVTPTHYCGVAKNVNGRLMHDIYDGDIVFVSPEGVKTVYKPADYLDAIGERSVAHSYATHTYYKPAGYPDGIYRTNSLAMLNACDEMPTPLAEAARKEMFTACVGENGKVIHNTFAYHWARIVETVGAFETLVGLLKDPKILSTDIKTLDVVPRAGRGVGMVDAPRGNLIYDMTTDAEGICRKLNIIVATNHNIAGIEKSVKHAAKQIFEDGALAGIKLPDPMVK